jgi:hypothetical protein
MMVSNTIQGTGGGIGIFGLVLIILLLVYVFGGLRLP